MAVLRFILGDQLSRSISSLDGADKRADVVLMVEAAREATYVRHHKQKIVLVLSAMRHFAISLRETGFNVDYVRMDDAENTASLSAELARALQRHDCDRVVVTEAGEWRVQEMIKSWSQTLKVPVEVREDTRFLSSIDEFRQWSSGRKTLRMEYFYRAMRRKTGWLMDGNQPEGGRWNYDADNRNALPPGIVAPSRHLYEPDPVTREIMTLVEARFGDHFGDLSTFNWAVQREDALDALAQFVTEYLLQFGDYQDAMKNGEDYLFHALISPYLNLGLLEAKEVCESVLEACKAGHAPIASVEGFIRQILGWREFVRGFYWMHMPEYPKSNFLNADQPLPQFFWTAETELECLRAALESTRLNAYAHHIQRLMVIGNFALLAGLSPALVEEWYLTVYADAYEWVELPNTHGMALFADGGMLASKPYAASGAYINRMSDYCSGCRYDPTARRGTNPCPFNYLYWNFLHRNREALQKIPRMGLALKNLDRIADETLFVHAQRADGFLESSCA
jgi:deoxyribodipyrimidine photolyase-related protein